jgi:Holliday junction resolvasome RuvABC endonuclease subunit
MNTKINNTTALVTSIYPAIPLDVEDIHIRPYQFQYNNSLDKIYIGIDPGSRNMGMSILSDTMSMSFEITYPPEKDAVKRILKVYTTTKLCFQYVFYEGIRFPPLSISAVIEGSSFGDKYGQATLADARTAAFMSIYEIANREHYDCQAKYIPPQSIRKQVFGSAKIKGEEVWKDQLPPDAASSLVCAICAVFQSQQTPTETPTHEMKS